MIEVSGLVRDFDGIRAVDGVSFTVGAGEVFGFIGPNGAGKTTTIRILATLLEPTEGRAAVGGHDVVHEPEKVRALIGYMPDVFGVYDGVTVREYLEFFAAAYRVPRRERVRVLEQVMDLTDLGDLRDRGVAQLSKGVRQRLGLAKTLVHDPAVLILDEPASGLDPRARIEIRALLKELARMGKTVLVSSHILTELADLVDRVGIIERGRLVACGTLDEISGGRASSLLVRVQFLDRETAGKGRELAAAHPLVAQARIDGRELVCDFSGGPADIRLLLGALVSAGLPVTGLSHDRHSLEEVFLRVTRGELQ